MVVHEAEGTVELTEHDAGEGFATTDRTSGFGLLGMRERLALVNGTVTIDSAVGEGTTVHASIPVNRVFPAESAAVANSA